MPTVRTQILALGLGLAFLPYTTKAQQNPAGLALPHTAKVTDTFTPLPPSEIRLTGGMLGTRIDANEKNRMLKVDENDLLDCFERRDVPHQDWQGEHVGKFLHAATLAWQNTGDPALKSKLDRVVTRLLRTQEADGYLGTYPANKRWTSWDVWCHKYALIGLLTYYQYTKPRIAFIDYTGSGPTPDLNAQSLAACRKIGDLLIRTFGDAPGQRDINKSGEQAGMAPDSVLEAMVLLYRATNDPRYQQFATYIVTHYDAPGGPAILTSLEKTKSVRKVANAKAYEMTSNFNGILELYRVTGNKRYLNDMLTAWQDIVDNRLYITGSASSYELFQDDFKFPNGQSANICETCVTVTWEQMNLELLRLTGQARFADQLERSIYNHLLGAQKPTGDDWAYYTPLDGHKPYDSATTCCHSSGPRGIALIPEIATMVSGDNGIVVNLYNSGTATVHLPPVLFPESSSTIHDFHLSSKPSPTKSGSASSSKGRAVAVTIKQETNYPLDGKITLTVTPERNGTKFPLRLRIPAWARLCFIDVNGKFVAGRGGGRMCLVGPEKKGWMERAADLYPSGIVTANYENITRTWNKGDKVEILLDMHPQLLPATHENKHDQTLGLHELTGTAAITYGPLVLALDSALNPDVPLKRLELVSSDMRFSDKKFYDASFFDERYFRLLPETETRAYPFPVFKVAGREAGKTQLRKLLLTPYAWAGADGKSRFKVWMPLPGQAKAGPGSVFSAFSDGKMSVSRVGNVSGDIADDDTDTYAVTYNNQKSEEDWFAVTLDKPVLINRIAFAHGQTFHDGGWFDTSGGKPVVQVQTEPGGAWKTVATLEDYPATTSANAGGLQPGQTFKAKFARIWAVAIRISGKPACGDNPEQSFASCAELQAFFNGN